MPVIEAVYVNGKFRPVGPVDLPENQRVRLTVEVSKKPSPEEWFAQAQIFRDYLFAKYGMFPDSTPDIAEDRRRDV